MIKRMKILASLLLLCALPVAADILNPNEVLARIDGKAVTRADLVASLPSEMRAEYERRFTQLEDAKARAVRDLIGRRTIAAQAAQQHVDEQQVIDREYNRSRTEIATSFRSEIAAQEEEIYRAERVFLQRLVDDRKMAAVAAAQGKTAEQLERELAASVPPPSADEVQFMINYEMARRRAGSSGANSEQQVAQAILDARVSQKKRQLVEHAKQQPNVEYLIQAPRVVVSADDDPRRGPANAPVQIVMWSDFECPYCAQAEPVLARIRDAYGDKVAVTFRDFPLPIHPLAMMAAKSANCSAASGKYWEFHDLLFANQGDLTRDKIGAIADTLSLDRNALAKCYDSPATTAEIEKDVADGRALGVDSTPTFFVNGRMLAGAQTFEQLATVIDDELSR